MHFDDSYDPYKAAYGSMPSHAATNPDIKQLYIDGHFWYAYKFGIVTNGLGIVHSIRFYNQVFFDKHPEIILNKKSDSPNEDKSVRDARLLIPTLQDLFAAHPLLNPHIFLGDAAFDSAKLYKELLSEDTFGTDADGNGKHFQKAYIPLNSRAGLKNRHYSMNQESIPCYPNDSFLPLKPKGISTRRNGLIPL